MKFLRYVITVVFIVFSLLAVSGSSKDSEEEYNTVEDSEPDSLLLYALEKDHAGLFECGTPAEDVEAVSELYGEVEIVEVDRMTEGMSNPVLELTFENETSKTLVLELIETDHSIWEIWRIGIFSDRFSTEEGISIGSTFEDLEDNYLIEGVFWGENGDPCAVVEALRMSFILEQGDWWQMGEVVGEIPDDTKIIHILVVGN